MLAPLPAAFSPTRDALHALACYVVAPARKALTGRIGLRPVGDGIGTPPLPDGSRIVVRGSAVAREPGPSAPITTLRAAAELLGVALRADPGVGRDLPPFDPDAPLAVDEAASFALGAWYRFGAQVLDRLGAGAGGVSEAQLWPEHFDLAVVVDEGPGVNVGFSAGDGTHDAPYLYVGPHSMDRLTGAYWNAPFGALATYDALAAHPDPETSAVEFVRAGLALVSELRAAGA